VAKFDLNAFFADASNRHESGRGFRRIRCWDGLTFSAQASEGHFCLPTKDFGPWTAVEIGFPSRKVEEFKGFEDSCDPDDSTGIYSRVPVEIVEAVVEKHGGWIANAEDSMSECDRKEALLARWRDDGYPT